ncbi:MAG: hypothetical protein HRU15_19610 [Planctomycetes bacterium]|nr:hypothetical protein [Planctomycetota bacterium]
MTKAKNNQLESGRFWSFSFIVHAIALVLLVYIFQGELYPEKSKEKPKTKIRLEDEALKEVIENIRDVQADKLRRRVALLGGGIDRMEVNLLNIQGRNRGFSNAQRTVAYNRILTLAETIETQLEDYRKLHVAHENELLTFDDIRWGDIQFVRIRSNAEELDAAVPLLPDEKYEKTDKEGKKIVDEEGNVEMGSHLDDLQGLSTRLVGGVNFVTQFHGWFNANDRHIYKARDRIKENTNNKVALTKQIAADAVLAKEVESKIADANTQLAAVKNNTELEKKQKQESTQKINKSLHALQKEQRSLKNDSNQKKLNKAIKNIAAEEKGIKDAYVRRELKFKEVNNHLKNLETTRYWAEEVVKRFDPAKISKDLKEEVEDQGAFKLVIKPKKRSAPGSELRGMDIYDLFEKSDELVVKLTSDYRSVKAIQLAQNRNMSFEKALELIQKIDSLPTVVDKQILRADITDSDMVEPHKKEIEKVKLSVEEKIELAQRLLLEVEEFIAQHSAQGETDAKTLEEILAQQIFDEDQEQTDSAEDAELAEKMSADFEEQREELNAQMQEMAELARADSQEQEKDLAEAMKKFMDIQDLTKEEDEEQEASDAAFELKLDSGEESSSAGSPGPALSASAPHVLARKIGEKGEPVPWMFVDTWYTIGPFGNEGRRNINTKFPPETLVDLSAVYIGKDEKRVRWTFVQSRAPEVNPHDAAEYAIYYAFTEIHCEKACDVWIAIGSDDKANVWINDMPVWISGNSLKGWNISEGFRKVHLKKGNNKVLYRIENGWLGVAFSMSIYASRN